MSLVTKLLVGLVFLGIIDIMIPLPITGIILIYALLQKPRWFIELVEEVYHEN